MSLTIRLVTDQRGLDELAAAWLKLNAAGAGDPLFGSYDWNSLWWRHYHELGDLYVPVAMDGDATVGLWPLYRSTRTFGDVEKDMIGERQMPLPAKGLKLRVLAYLGSGEICSDFLGPVILPGREAEVLAALAAHLAHDRSWHLLDLPDMLADGPTTVPLEQALARRFGKARRRFRYEAPYAPLAATYDEFLNTLSKKSRYNARKKLKQLGLNHRVEHVFHSDPATLREAMDRFISLHQERWNADGLPGVFVNERFRGFHHAMAAKGLERGWLRLGALRVNDRTIFATYAYRVGERLYLYQQGSEADPHWDNYNIGYVALHFAISGAVEEGAKEYDFLRGNAAYKLHWTTAKRELVQLQAMRGLRGRLFRWHSAINTDDQFRTRIKRLIGRK